MEWIERELITPGANERRRVRRLRVLGPELLAGAVQLSINGQAGRILGEPGDVLSARIGRDDYQDFLVRY